MKAYCALCCSAWLVICACARDGLEMPVDTGGTGASNARDSALDAPSELDASNDALATVPCLQRAVACEPNSTSVDWSSIESPIAATMFTRWTDGRLVLAKGGAFDPCVITRDGCAELRVDFDADGCLAEVHRPTDMHHPDGGAFGPLAFPGLIECNQTAWSRQRWPCLAGTSVFQIETCFD